MKLRRTLVATAVTAVLSSGAVVLAASSPATAATSQLGGPVIIGGDDLNDHGYFDGTDNQTGWKYIQSALSNIKSQVTRANDGTVAVLGGSDSESTSSDGGGAAHYTIAKIPGLTAQYVDGEQAIDTYLDGVAAGTNKPEILYIVGNETINDLSSGPGDEGQALADNATTIADFVNGGGGLLSHGTEFRWLAGLLPGVSTVGGGSSDDLVKTAEGNSSFPDVSEAEFNAGPWHAYFEGNLGGLSVLVRSTSIQDSNGANAPVIIGGSAAQLPGSISLSPASGSGTVGGSHTVTATTRNNDGSLAAGKQVSFSITSGPNAGKTGSGTTGSNGTVDFTYTDTAMVNGTDTIQASFVDDTGATRTATATWEWTGASTGGDPAAPTCTVAASTTTPGSYDFTFTDANADIRLLRLVPRRNFTWVLDGKPQAVKVTYKRTGVTDKLLTVTPTRATPVSVRVQMVDFGRHYKWCSYTLPGTGATQAR